MLGKWKVVKKRHYSTQQLCEVKPTSEGLAPLPKQSQGKSEPAAYSQNKQNQLGKKKDWRQVELLMSWSNWHAHTGDMQAGLSGAQR